MAWHMHVAEEVPSVRNFLASWCVLVKIVKISASQKFPAIWYLEFGGKNRHKLSLLLPLSTLSLSLHK